MTACNGVTNGVTNAFVTTTGVTLTPTRPDPTHKYYSLHLDGWLAGHNAREAVPTPCA